MIATELKSDFKITTDASYFALTSEWVSEGGREGGRECSPVCAGSANRADQQFCIAIHTRAFRMYPHGIHGDAIEPDDAVVVRELGAQVFQSPIVRRPHLVTVDDIRIRLTSVGVVAPIRCPREYRSEDDLQSGRDRKYINYLLLHRWRQ